jgi:hypothetical protein
MRSSGEKNRRTNALPLTLVSNKFARSYTWQKGKAGSNPTKMSVGLEGGSRFLSRQMKREA